MSFNVSLRSALDLITFSMCGESKNQDFFVHEKWNVQHWWLSEFDFEKLKTSYCSVATKLDNGKIDFYDRKRKKRSIMWPWKLFKAQTKQSNWEKCIRKTAKNRNKHNSGDLIIENFLFKWNFSNPKSKIFKFFENKN